VLNKQREIIYSQRTRIMEIAQDKQKSLGEFLKSQTEKLIATQLAPLKTQSQLNSELAASILENYFSLNDREKKQLSALSYSQFETSFRQNLDRIFADKRKRFGTEVFDEAIKILYLSTIDHYFTEHLTHIESLREGISLRGYAQLDPLNEYKKESYQIFNNMLANIRIDFFRRLTHLDITPGVVRSDVTVQKPKVKIGRNDPCPCGSGKKYKKCCYPKYG